MTTKPEHDTHEQPTAANYTAGDSFAKVSADCRKIIERIEALAAIPAGELPALLDALYQRGYEDREKEKSYDPRGSKEWEAIAASHCAQGDGGPLTQYAVDFIGGWLEGENEEVGRNWERVREAALAKQSQPADKPARCIDCHEPGAAICEICADCRCESVASAVRDKPAGQAVTDAQIEAALDTKVGLDHTLRSLIRGDTVAVGWSKVDVVRKLLAALAPEPATAGELPALPELTKIADNAYAYTTRQMREYAREALAASHRERGAQPVDKSADSFLGKRGSTADTLRDVPKETLDAIKQFRTVKPAGQAVTDARIRVHVEQTAYDLGYQNPGTESKRLNVEWLHLTVVNAYRCGQMDAQDQRPRNRTYSPVLYDAETFIRLDEALAPEPTTAGTPSSHWRADGEPDPHGAVYDCERSRLAHGGMTDDELANAVFLCNHRGGDFASIGLLTAAKDRIRWLSRRLEEAKATPAAAVPDGMVLVKAYANCGQYADDQPGTRAECSARIKRGDPCERCPRRVAAPANRPADAPIRINDESFDDRDRQREPVATDVPNEVVDRMILAWFQFPLDRGLHPSDQESMRPAMREAAQVLLAASPADPLPSLIDAARAMGETGAPPNEAERLAFEAWMQGHCWALCATWRGTEYRSDVEDASGYCANAGRTRGLWAAWRDRAALISTLPASEVSS